MTPRKKESVKTVVPCTLGKMCSWDNVNDTVHSEKIHQHKSETWPYGLE